MFQQRRAYWRNLDNAAKMFSAASSPKDTRVFRFYCVLKKRLTEVFLRWHWIRVSEIGLSVSHAKRTSGIILRKVISAGRKGRVQGTVQPSLYKR